MYSALKIWTASRTLILSCAGLSSKVMPHHDFSDALLNDSGLFSFLLRWDAIYFYKICEEGYISENSTAFLPFFPFLVHLLKHALRCSYSFSGFLLSNACFLFSALFLYKITTEHLGEDVAISSCFLFCFSPCSILYSSMYTESLFCFLVLFAVHEVLRRKKKMACALLALASATRSNGIVLAPLLCLEDVFKGKFLSSLYVIPCISLFLGIEAYWWITRFSYIGWKVPYSYIQEKYWDQGFLNFYRDSKNIPNIFVGAPFVALSLIILLNYALREYQNILISYRKKRIRKYFSLFELIRCFLSFVLLFQVILSIFFIHMNMHFRFVSYNPIIYWELSMIIRKKHFFFSLLLFGYLAFGVTYSCLYGAYFPPA
ncbi:GPI mannosyltransferase 2 [Nematocida sp. LUAm3]|nr:GPI mannosyltransferase 2 [Nematocida sp. LUAm3]KAI5174045.1 GPI mannosyltransferase 2 [Nematocida sp. LUAm2]KAI5177212.1 GPI mannosyltransferase 2 [Nematocida sp. LUAm1]